MEAKSGGLTSIPPLTDDKEFTTLRLFHVEHHQYHGECNCGDEWPCDLARALARIEQDRTLLRRCLHVLTCSGPAKEFMDWEEEEVELIADLRAAGVSE